MERETRKLTLGSKPILAGVCSGFAQYLNHDPRFVRLAFILLSLFLGGGLIAYLVCYIFMPFYETSGEVRRAARLK